MNVMTNFKMKFKTKFTARALCIALLLTFCAPAQAALKVTALCEAVRNVDGETVARLISEGADVTEMCDKKVGRTPLIFAVVHNAYDIAESLLRAGAPPNQKGKYGTIWPMQAAAWRNNTRIASLLRRYGADVNLTRDEVSLFISSVLYDTVLQGHDEFASWLLQNGADPNSPDSHSNTPLHYAAANRRPEIARLLIRHGADVNDTGFRRKTPLHFATKDAEIIRILLDNGANINARDADNKTPLDIRLEALRDAPALLLKSRGAQ